MSQYVLLILVGSVPVFWCLPKKWRFPFLAASGVSSLSLLDSTAVMILVVGSLLAFAYARYGQSTRYSTTIAWSLVAIILAYLLYSKYIWPRVAGAMGVTDVAIPLGVSYFSFKLLHFVTEVKRKSLHDVSLPMFMTYVFLVPIFTAGPIERYDHFREHLQTDWSTERFAEGLWRIIHGLIKKFVLAAFVSSLIDQGDRLYYFTHTATQVSIGEIWIHMALTYAYIYLDFSAYCDLAIGASLLFGIRISENFRWPIASANIVEFWQRWHITLRAWCQSYIYLPIIAVTRMPYLALIFTFLTMGLWHEGSMTYFCWGLYHASGVAIFQRWQRTPLRRRLTKLNNVGVQVGAMLLTNAFICGSHIWSSHSSASVYDRLTLLARMFLFVDFLGIP